MPGTPPGLLQLWGLGLSAGPALCKADEMRWHASVQTKQDQEWVPAKKSKDLNLNHNPNFPNGNV